MSTEVSLGITSFWSVAGLCTAVLLWPLMATLSSESGDRPRVGIPYRTRKEELASDRSRYQLYVDAVRHAGAEAVEVSLSLNPKELTAVANSLDAVLLPGSPKDVDPKRFGAARHPKTADQDPDRERIDFGLLENAFAEHKPVLAICYGIQSLNVFLGGSLIQDIPSELHTKIQHSWDRASGELEPFHSARVESGSRLEQLAKASELQINSSHHQSILELGRGLRVTARAPDGVVEAAEWIGDANWVMGVQWHPERMVETGAVARALFETLIAAARTPAHPTV